MKYKSRLEMKVGIIMNPVNLSGELNVKLLRFDCNFFFPHPWVAIEIKVPQELSIKMWAECVVIF